MKNLLLTILVGLFMFSLIPGVFAQKILSKTTAFDFASLEGDWKGIWKNTTFGSTDSIFATMAVNPDSKKVHVEIMTKGIFGDPTPVHYIYDQYYTEETDTVRIAPPASLTGEIVVADDGNITGQISEPAFNLTVDFNGTFNTYDIIVNYILSGAFSATGFVELHKTGVTDVQELVQSSELPGSFELFANYPNPFNPETNIPFAIHESGFVNLQIYNISGQAVKELVNRELRSGHYNAIWDGRDNSGRPLSSGAYIARLMTNRLVTAQRMTLLK